MPGPHPEVFNPRPQSEEEAVLGPFLYNHYMKSLAEAEELEAKDPVKYKGYYGRINDLYRQALERSRKGQNVDDAYPVEIPAPTPSPWQRILKVLAPTTTRFPF
jgi:hypothetical protein